MTDPSYFLWKAPVDGPPEFTSGGFGVTVLPGFGQWVIIHGHVRAAPSGAIPVADVVSLLEAHS